MKPATRLLLATDVTKRYGRTQALCEVNLEIQPGITGLIGPNGAGKSTLLKIGLGLVKADTGRVELLGMDIKTKGAVARRTVGVLHEKPRYPSHITGFDYLRFTAGIKGVRDPERRIRELANENGIADALGRPIGTYSAGMVQRFGLTDAILGDPKLVILDEPTANLDPTGRTQLLEKVSSLWTQRGISVIFSTHLLSEVERVATQVVIMDQGRVKTTTPMARLRQGSAKRLLIKVSRPDEFAAAWDDQKLPTLQVTPDGFVIDPVGPNAETLIDCVNEVVRLTGSKIQALTWARPSLEEFFQHAIGDSR